MKTNEIGTKEKITTYELRQIKTRVDVLNLMNITPITVTIYLFYLSKIVSHNNYYINVFI